MAKLAVKTDTRATKLRSTVSFPAEQYEELERIADANHVSVAWVIRAAVSRYLAEQWPLFSNTRHTGEQ